jgi:hypothetical protein
MKCHLLITGVMILTTSLGAMETQEIPHIILINKIPKNIEIEEGVYINPCIDIAYTGRLNNFHNQPYKKERDTYSLLSNTKIIITPPTDTTKPEYERLGMNNAKTAALIQLYIHAAINPEHKVLKLFFGNNKQIKPGDSITFNYTRKNDSITMKHNNNTILLTIPCACSTITNLPTIPTPFACSVKTIGIQIPLDDPLTWIINPL